MHSGRKERRREKSKKEKVPHQIPALLIPSNLLSTNMPPSVMRGACLESQSTAMRRGLWRFCAARLAPGRNGRVEETSGVGLAVVEEEAVGGAAMGFEGVAGGCNARSMGGCTWY